MPQIVQLKLLIISVIISTSTADVVAEVWQHEIYSSLDWLYKVTLFLLYPFMEVTETTEVILCQELTEHNASWSVDITGIDLCIFTGPLLQPSCPQCFLLLASPSREDVEGLFVTQSSSLWSLELCSRTALTLCASFKRTDWPRFDQLVFMYGTTMFARKCASY